MQYEDIENRVLNKLWNPVLKKIKTEIMWQVYKQVEGKTYIELLNQIKNPIERQIAKEI